MLFDFVNYSIPVYVILALVCGYLAISLLSTWRTRASFFLTVLVVSVIGHSLIGVTVSSVPALVSVFFFEWERHKSNSGVTYIEVRNARFKSFPIEKWDGVTPLVIFDTDIFLFGDKVFERIADLQAKSGLQICKCGPVYLQEVDDYVMLDGMNYGATLPTNVKDALDALNLAIRKADAVSWEQTEVAIDIPDLQERARRWQRGKEFESAGIPVAMEKA